MHQLHTSPSVDAIYNQLIRNRTCLLAIASPSPQSGNSLLSLALAQRMAQAEKRVLLIEFNNESPSLHQRTGTRQSNWLPCDDSWQDALQKTGCPGLMVLTAPLHDQTHPDNIEFRNTEVLCSFFGQALDSFDIIICDTPPLLHSSDGAICGVTIASVCETCMLNVVTHVTTESQIDEARQVLKQANIPLCGAVMNDRYSPGLREEMLREIKRLDRWLPRLAGYLRKKVEASDLINQPL
ncbi:CpsD/CapB family tyrosine-protein kinase [Aliamphritea hakodatensis]|uniref:CpsD/CapB family tyrosine-protein kinase n=1 Tax=Aliamphritea hakodatensis TaxID=2895352 RepID=UPI0022FDAE09|nr:CpsD/CapB family tyrosine-protein kinase [Aliamphritea hakodatensis]